MPALSDSAIESMFGAEAAEAERDERLLEYFYRSPLYDQVISDSSLKLVVGFKGTGKSALMRMGYLHDRKVGAEALWLTPDDLGGKVYADAGGKEGEGNQSRMMKGIRVWKQALTELILRKVTGLEVLPPDISRRVRAGEIKVAGLLREIRPEREHAQITLYMDDLDRVWSGRPADRVAVTALIYALRDICRENRQIKARLSMRWDVYWDVRETDQGLDKVETNKVEVKWTQQDVFVMLVKRVMTAHGKEAREEELRSWDQRRLAAELGVVFEERVSGTWAGREMHKVLLSLVRRRPRDMVKLATFAGRRAVARRAGRIGGQDLVEVIPEYSMGRVQDLINEFRQVEPATERLIFGMRPREEGGRARWRYATDELVQRLRGVVAQLGGRPEPYQAAHWLYKIGFLTARKDHEGGYIERRYWDEYPWLLTASGDGGYHWEVHPAYREALSGDRFRRWLSGEEIESWAELETRGTRG
jgi:hypothetical protein